MDEAVEMLRWFPTPRLVANPPAAHEPSPNRRPLAGYVYVLGVADGLRHPKGDYSGVWLLDVEDSADPDPIVYRAEIAPASLQATHVSLRAFVGWLVCRAHCQRREDYQRLADLVGG